MTQGANQTAGSLLQSAEHAVPTWETRYERTCRFTPENIHWYFDENDNEVQTEEGHPDGSDCCICSKCGYPMMAGEGGWFDESEGPHGGILYKPRFKFCPDCGCRVKED